MNFDVKKIGKLALPIAGIVLTMAANVVNSKNQEAQMEQTIAKKVAEALENQAKES
jgi:uncharacterized protein YejL (UPF0352 family)